MGTYFTTDIDVLGKISSDLKQVGCCSRCILRYLGLSDMTTYKGDTQEMDKRVEELCNKLKIKKMDNDDACTDSMDVGEDKVYSENAEIEREESTSQNGTGGEKDIPEATDAGSSCGTCVVCLGILHQFSTKEFLEQIKSKTEEFQFTSYLCSVKIPVCVILREHALMVYLKDKYQEVYAGKKYTDVSCVKDIWKWNNGPVLKGLLDTSFVGKSAFLIILNFIYKNSDKECSFLLSADTDTFRKRKEDKRYARRSKTSQFAVYNFTNVAKAVEEMPEEDFKRLYQCPPRQQTCETTCDICCQNDNVFVAGRYNKYSRTLSQTPWLIDGVRKSESSVEELLCDEIKIHFKHTEQRFSSSGREDVDVLMLGSGRPFVLELVNPRCRDFTQEQLTDIQKNINAATKDIKCTDLQIVSREDTERLKEGEIDKVKQYSALCWCKEKVLPEKLQSLEQQKDITILQKTPIRVLHRRPLATRDKIIHSISVCEQIDDHHFKINLSTQAGTYIKEFVHGDFGRTKPNLTSLLGVDCDILELDVMAVELDWPKKIETTT